MLRRTDLGGDAWFEYDGAWMPHDEADAALIELLRTEPWEQRPIVVFGRERMQPRLISWAGDRPYRYSGQTLPPRPVEGLLARLLARVREACGVPFDHVLLNRYRDGADRMALHADNEPELGKDPVIAALSLGAQRRFKLVPKDRRSERRSLLLSHGSLLVMGGTIQHRWRHGVPKMARVQGERINVTFRRLMGPPGWRGD